MTYHECIACSGPLNVYGTVGICTRCGGLNGDFDSKEDLARFVDLRLPMLDDCHVPTYFDATIGDQRVHGFFDVGSRRVVQFG